MIFKKMNLCIFYLVILLGLATHNCPAWAQSNAALKLDATRISWTQFSFYAKNFWVEVSTDIQLSSIAASDLDALLLASPKGNPIQPVTPQAAQMAINTTIDPRFRSPVNIYNCIWFNPTNASALGRIRLRRGEDDFKKMYRFTEQGVFRHRMEPKDKSEAKLKPKNWTDIKDSFYAYDLTRLGCSAATERSLLIYILSAATALKKNGTMSLCVFGKRQLHYVKLQPSGVFPIKSNYIEKREQGEIRRQEIVKTIKINLSSQPMESDLSEAENFSFLGFHRDISIHIDPASGIPIQVSGTIPTAGKAVLNLNSVWLKN